LTETQKIAYNIPDIRSKQANKVS